MAIFAAAATKAIKSLDEITVGMELWEASWQFRTGSIGAHPLFVTSLPVKLGESRFNDNGYTIEDNMYHEYIIPFERFEDRSEEGRVFCQDTNVGWGEDASYNDHFLFRSKEDAEEFVKAGAALLENDLEVLKAFTFREIEGAIFQSFEHDMLEDLTDDDYDDVDPEEVYASEFHDYPEDDDDYEINGED